MRPTLIVSTARDDADPVVHPMCGIDASLQSGADRVPDRHCPHGHAYLFDADLFDSSAGNQHGDLRIEKNLIAYRWEVLKSVLKGGDSNP